MLISRGSMLVTLKGEGISIYSPLPLVTRDKIASRGKKYPRIRA
jgi:hypothetical protein